MMLLSGSKSKQEMQARLWPSTAIDIETGDFEVGETVIATTNRLFERHPDAQPWRIWVGQGAVYHFGSRSLKQNQ